MHTVIYLFIYFFCFLFIIDRMLKREYQQDNFDHLVIVHLFVFFSFVISKLVLLFVAGIFIVCCVCICMKNSLHFVDWKIIKTQDYW